MVFINSPINFSPPLRMTINVPPIMTPSLPIVILNGRKNALWKSSKAAIWHGVKNLWLGWRLTVFLITAIDSSLSLWMTPYHFPHHGSKFFAAAHTRTLNVSRHSDSFLQSSFWTVARMLFKKNGKRDSDTEWRIYDSDDILPLSSPQVQSLHIRFGWRLTFSSLQQQILCWCFVWHLMEIICFSF